MTNDERMTNDEGQKVAPAQPIQRTALNSIVGGAIWALGGIILDCNRDEIPSSRPWLVGMPLIIPVVFSAWGTLLGFLSASRHRICITVVATIVSLFLGVGGIFLFSFCVGNWPILLSKGITALFLPIGVLAGFLQVTIISGFDRPSNLK
jgi:hypothetical protein